MAFSLLDTQTSPFRRVASLIPPEYLISGILFGRRSIFSGCITSGILSVDIPPYPDISHPESCPTEVPTSPGISQPPFCPAEIPTSPGYLTIAIYVRPKFPLHPDISQRHSVRPKFHPPGCLTSGLVRRHSIHPDVSHPKLSADIPPYPNVSPPAPGV